MGQLTGLYYRVVVRRLQPHLRSARFTLVAHYPGQKPYRTLWALLPSEHVCACAARFSFRPLYYTIHIEIVFFRL